MHTLLLSTEVPRILGVSSGGNKDVEKSFPSRPDDETSALKSSHNHSHDDNDDNDDNDNDANAL